MAVTIEQLLDKISDELIIKEIVTPDIVESNQKVVRNGLIQLGRTQNDALVLYQRDEEANEADLLFTPNEGDEIQTLQEIAQIIQDGDISNVEVSIQATETSYTVSISYNGEDYPIDFIVNPDNNNPLNVSQFIPIKKQSTFVNPEQANEFLDTTIFELLPDGDTRQARINRFFQELNALLPPFGQIPDFGTPVERGEDGNWVGEEQYD